VPGLRTLEVAEPTPQSAVVRPVNVEARRIGREVARGGGFRNHERPCSAVTPLETCVTRTRPMPAAVFAGHRMSAWRFLVRDCTMTESFSVPSKSTNLQPPRTDSNLKDSLPWSVPLVMAESDKTVSPPAQTTLRSGKSSARKDRT